MIGMQEMLLQTHALPGEQEKLRVLPAWPEEWDVDFKLHAPGQTIISAVYQDAELKKLDVEPPERQADIIVGDCE